jgi:hypothetical protein
MRNLPVGGLVKGRWHQEEVYVVLTCVLLNRITPVCMGEETAWALELFLTSSDWIIPREIIFEQASS